MGGVGIGTAVGAITDVGASVAVGVAAGWVGDGGWRVGCVGDGGVETLIAVGTAVAGSCCAMLGGGESVGGGAAISPAQAVRSSTITLLRRLRRILKVGGVRACIAFLSTVQCSSAGRAECVCSAAGHLALHALDGKRWRFDWRLLKR